MIFVERYKDEEIESVTIDGESLTSDDDLGWTTPEALLRPYKVSDLPENVCFSLCREIQDDIVMLDRMPIGIERTGKSIQISFHDSGTRKHWGGSVGFSYYMETKRDIIEERQREIGDIVLDSYEDDGNYIFLYFSTTVTATTCDELLSISDQLITEIEGAAELRMGVDAFAPAPAENERQFTLSTVLPILRKLGFINVRYNHGKREYGKDIVFARVTEFGDLEHWVAQVKHGDMSGKVGGDIDEIFGQIEDCFKMPFFDVYTRTSVRPSKVCVIVSGHFSENATEKICEKIESHAIKNNLVFVDGAQIATLAERFQSHKVK